MPERKIQVSITGVNQATAAFQTLARDLDSVAKKAVQSSAALAGQTRASQTFAANLGSASRAASSFSVNLGAVGRAGSVFSGITGAIGGVGKALGNVTQQAVAFTAGLLAAQAVQRGFTAATDTVIGFNASLEQSQQAWSVFLKSGERAEAMLFKMQQFAAATPFRYQDVERNARSLVAMGFAAADVFDMMTDIGNLAAAYGGTAVQVDGITRALGQMHTAGRLNAQDMMQLTSVGIPAWEILSKAIGKSVAETRALSEQGEITGDVMVEAVRKFAQTNFGDMMARQMKTFVGSMSTIWDSLQIVGSTAFRPLFDNISKLAQRFSEFVSSDAFMAWGAGVAAVVDVVLSSLGDLAGGFADALGGILDIVLGVGQLIYEALSWLNPWAEHSPSLVSQVKTGADAIGAAYEGLSSDVRQQMGIASQAIAQFGSQPNTLKKIASDAKDEFDRLKGSLTDAEGKLRDFMQAPLKEAEPFDKRLAAIQREQDRVQQQLNQTISGRGTHRLVDTLTKQLENLRRQAENVQIEKRLKLGPLEDQLEALTKPKAISFIEKIKGIKDAQKDIATLTPKVAEAEVKYKGLADAVEEVTGAASKAAGALAGMGSTTVTDKLKGIDELLADSKRQLDEWKRGFESAKNTVLRDTAPIRNALNRYILEPIRTIASLTKTIGAPGGGWGKFFEQLQLYWEQSPFKKPVDDFLLGLKDLPAKLQARLGELWALIDWAKVWATVKDISGTVATWLGEQWAKIDWGAVWKAAGDFAGSLGKWIDDNGPAIEAQFGKLAGMAGKWIGEFWDKAPDTQAGQVRQGFDEMTEGIMRGAEKFLPKVGGWAGQFAAGGLLAAAAFLNGLDAFIQGGGAARLGQLGLKFADAFIKGFSEGIGQALVLKVAPNVQKEWLVPPGQKEVEPPWWAKMFGLTDPQGRPIPLVQTQDAFEKTGDKAKDMATGIGDAFGDIGTDYNTSARDALYWSQKTDTATGDALAGVRQFAIDGARWLDGFGRSIQGVVDDWMLTKRTIENNPIKFPAVPGTVPTGGGAPPSGRWQARAEGGPVLPGHAYLVGERGPEPFIPSLPGIILPHNTPVGGNLTVQFTGPLIGTAQISKEVDLDEVLRRLAQWLRHDLDQAIGQWARSPVGLTPRM